MKPEDFAEIVLHTEVVSAAARDGAVVVYTVTDSETIDKFGSGNVTYALRTCLRAGALAVKGRENG